MKHIAFGCILLFCSFAFAGTTLPSTGPTTSPTTKPWVGLVVADYTSAENPKAAARVDAADKKSPAAKMLAGDLITLWDGKPVRSKSDLDTYISHSTIGKTYVLGFLRKTPRQAQYTFFSEKITVAPETEHAKTVPPINFALGSIGLVLQVHVQQVIDAHNMTATIYQQQEEWVGPTGPVRGPGPHGFMTTVLKESPVVWFANIDTTGITDGVAKDFASVFEVTGTKTYETVSGGSKTVFIMSPKQPLPKEAYVRTGFEKALVGMTLGNISEITGSKVGQQYGIILDHADQNGRAYHVWHQWDGQGPNVCYHVTVNKDDVVTSFSTEEDYPQGRSVGGGVK